MELRRPIAIALAGLALNACQEQKQATILPPTLPVTGEFGIATAPSEAPLPRGFVESRETLPTSGYISTIETIDGRWVVFGRGSESELEGLRIWDTTQNKGYDLGKGSFGNVQGMHLETDSGGNLAEIFVAAGKDGFWGWDQENGLQQFSHPGTEKNTIYDVTVFKDQVTLATAEGAYFLNDTGWVPVFPQDSKFAHAPMNKIIAASDRGILYLTGPTNNFLIKYFTPDSTENRAYEWDGARTSFDMTLQRNSGQILIESTSGLDVYHYISEEEGDTIGSVVNKTTNVASSDSPNPHEFFSIDQEGLFVTSIDPQTLMRNFYSVDHALPQLAETEEITSLQVMWLPPSQLLGIIGTANGAFTFFIPADPANRNMTLIR